MSEDMSQETSQAAPAELHEQLGNPEPARAHWPSAGDSEIEMSEATRRELARAIARLHGRSALHPGLGDGFQRA